MQAETPSSGKVAETLANKVGSPAPLDPIDSAAANRGKKSNGPLTPTLSDSDEDHGFLSSPTSPPQGLSAISETEDPGDDSSDDQDAVHARSEGMQGMQKESEIKSGYLSKKGERRKVWQKRYFVLRPKRLSYYKDQKEYKLLRDIPLDDVHTVAQVQVKRHEHVFGIVTPQRTYYVEARSQAEMHHWVSQIEQARDDLKRTQAEEHSTATPDAADTPTRLPAPALVAPSRPISMSGPTSPSMGSPVGSSSLGTTGTLSAEGGSSSYMSQASAISLAPIAPPNSFVDGRIMTMGGGENLQSVDAHLLLRQREREHSNADSVATGSTHLHRPSSPGVISSSEDEDDDYFGEAPNPNVAVGSPSSFPLGSPLTLNALDPNKVIMSGYLTKQGKRKTWRKRFFILVSSRLMYARSHMDAKIHRQIPLARVLDVVDVEHIVGTPNRSRADSHAHDPPGLHSPHVHGHEKRFDNVFKIITAKRTYMLCAPDEESEIKWISAIKVLLNAQRSQHSPSMQTVKLPSTDQTHSSAPSAASVTTHSPPLPPPAVSPSSLTSSPPRAAGSSADATVGMPSIEAQLDKASVSHSVIPLGHARNRSATDAAKMAVREAGERFSARA